MNETLQKASMWKRISAGLFDGILLIMAVVGFAWLLSLVLGFDSHSQTLDRCYEKYEAQYQVTFHITQEEFDLLTQEQQEAFQQASAALSADETALHAYSMVISLSLLILSLSVLLGYLVLEFLVPLKLGNGQTLGKKIFGIALMRTDGIKLPTVALFVRTILGKYTVETMLPLLIVLLIFWGSIGFLGTLIIGIIGIIQVVLLIATGTNSLIHDFLANTVAVDYASQRIFRTTEDLIAYKQTLHADKVSRQAY